ncbi:geobacillin-26 family protein [Bacillus mycoides]|uniref:geobacillin-26 family protein n=1 Tax=Bacillus mycoides TaxID=1405 RepID=UPI002110E9A7|nr:geobacillin-26 family protein [Bacillus mycoides]MCQ6530518.1 geobacillin-26 family protein [Bacillus mycoides]
MNETNRKIAISAMALGLLTTTLPTLSLAEENNSISSNISTQLIQNQQSSLKVLKDDANEKIVESSDNHMVSTSTYDKKNKRVSISTKNLTDNTLSTQTMDLRNAESLVKSRKKREVYVIDRAVSLDGAFEYTFYNENVWVIKIPGENAKNPVENNENRAELNGFRNAVNNLMTNEISFLNKVGGETALLCVGLLSTPTPATAAAGAATAIGLAAWAIPDFVKMFQEADNCKYHFHRV